jgi:hypothetical protein
VFIGNAGIGIRDQTVSYPGRSQSAVIVLVSVLLHYISFRCRSTECCLDMHRVVLCVDSVKSAPHFSHLAPTCIRRLQPCRDNTKKSAFSLYSSSIPHHAYAGPFLNVSTRHSTIVRPFLMTARCAVLATRQFCRGRWVRAFCV